MKTEQEIWKDIDEDSCFQVSSMGRIRTRDRIIKCPKMSYIRKGAIQKSFKNKDGYMVARIRKNKKIVYYSVHRLVASLFIKNPLSKPVVNHINHNRRDNRVENLEWVTHQENMSHMVLSNRSAKGSCNASSKLDEIKVLSIRTMKDHNDWTDRKLGLAFGVSHTTIQNARKGYLWKHV